MNQKKTLIIFCCLASVLGFGGEILKFPLKDINVAATETGQSLHIPLEEVFSGSDTNTLTLQPETGNYAPGEIVYPLEESNFEEVFGSAP